MTRVRVSIVAALVLGVVVGAGAGCGFECQVKGEAQHFDGCDDLQKAFDAEQSKPQADGAVLDDLDTCGNAYGCNIQP